MLGINMDAMLFSVGTTVAQALSQGSPVVRVFIRNETACVGCFLMSFCTLDDVVKTYELSPQEFLFELQQSVSSDPSSSSGAKHEQEI